jgi:acyl-CoA thioesterase-1
MKKLLHFLVFGSLLLVSCSSDDDLKDIPQNNEIQIYHILSLGDSYTIGQSVCETCRFPEQLKDSLKARFVLNHVISLDVIARTGWTTTNIKDAIVIENPPSNYDIVTLLIGVNNQYQNKPFSLYEEEFPQLVNQAIGFAQGDKDNIIVVSIPDYAFTPFGQSTSNPQNTSNEIDVYNAFAQSYCEQNNIEFVNITDITRNGLSNPALVASDGLHPSELAYSKFVERILPVALEKIQ